MGKKMLEHDIKKILVSHDEITAAAKKLGAQLTKDYAGKKSNLSWDFKRIYSFLWLNWLNISTHILKWTS